MKKKLLIILSILQILAGILIILFGLHEKKLYYVMAIVLFFACGIIHLVCLVMEKENK